MCTVGRGNEVHPNAARICIAPVFNGDTEINRLCKYPVKSH